MRWRMVIPGAVVLMLGLIVGWPVAVHYRAKAKLAGYKQRLKDLNEKVTIAELAPKLSTEPAQAGRDLMQTAGFLRTSSPDWTNFPPAMKYVAPGKALVAWQQATLPSEATTNIWPGLHIEIAANQNALAQVRATLGVPQLGFDLDYHQGAALLLPHLAGLKGIAQWLSVATVFELHEGRLTNAWENLLALTALAGRWRDEPIMISELVRVAIAAIAVCTAWEALQSPDCTEVELKSLQAGWEAVDLLPQAEASLALERVTAEGTFVKARASYAYMASWFSPGGSSSGLSELTELGKQVLESPQEGFKAALHRYPGYWGWRWWQSYDDELASAELDQVCLEAVRGVQREKLWGAALKQMEGNAAVVKSEHPRAGQWLGYSPAEATPRFITRIFMFEIQRSLLIAAIALKRYRLGHGAYPNEIASLAPDFVGQIPRDIVDGKPLRYRLLSDGQFLLYSIGEDGVDNGGDPTPTPETRKYWVRARDAVWPAPARPEEAKTVLETLARKPLPPGSTASKK